MQEREMVLDILKSAKSAGQSYTMFISECNNIKLKDKFKLMRENTEKLHEDMYKIAKQKSYYIPPSNAAEIDVQQLKQNITEVITRLEGSGPIPNM